MGLFFLGPTTRFIDLKVGQSHCFGCRPPVSPNPPGQIGRENSLEVGDLLTGGLQPDTYWDSAETRAECISEWITSFG
jgi:hypothetical protein